MKRSTAAIAEQPSYDSFLDIVANLVGILVILIMVIGVRAKDAWSERARDPVVAALPSESVPDVQAVKTLAASLRADVAEAAHQTDRLHGQIEQATQYQSQLHQQISQLQGNIDRDRQRLDWRDQQQRQLDRQIASSRDQLVALARDRSELERRELSPVVIQHHPTPLAQTVFGREDHYRLLRGRITHVPLNELTDQLKSEAKVKLWKLNDAPSFTETIGPLEGFLLRYTLVRRDVTMRTAAGTARGSVVELDQFVLVPQREDLGEPLAVALQPDSALNRRLDGLIPDATTITVWTYPDSYAEFRQLKQYLEHRGFLTAARPLPQGHPISGSPQGSRSAAQ